jgi:hypothetical protein
MTLADTLLAPAFPTIDTIVRADGGVFRCPLYRAGVLVAPSAGGTFALLNASGATLRSGTVTIPDSVATFTVAASYVESETFGDGWLARWDLTVGGATHRFQNAAALVFRQLYPVVSDRDLFAVESGLNPAPAAGVQPITRAADHQVKLDEAWHQIQRRVVAGGRRPWLAMDPSAFRDVHRYLALALIFEDLSTRNNPSYAEKAARYFTRYDQAWNELQWRETTDDGVPTSKRRSGAPTFWLSGRG